MRSPFLPLLVLLVTLGCEAVGEEGNEPDAWVTIRGVRVASEVMVTPTEQARGLGYRDSLAWSHGMLFTYDEPGFRSFWMKGMRFDIDIVWITGYGFPDYRGGPMFHADQRGLAEILNAIRRYESTHGDAWKPAARLVELAESGGRFGG